MFLCFCAWHALNLVRFHRVEHGEEVGAVDLPSLRHTVWEVQMQLLVLAEHLKNVFDIEFLVERHVNWLHFGHLEELLLFSQHCLKPVLPNVVQRRQVVLHYASQSRQFMVLTVVSQDVVEVLLGAELVGEFVVWNLDELALFRVHHYFIFKLIVNCIDPTSS